MKNPTQKVVYREREEFCFEHIAVVDGVHHKIENGELYIREINFVLEEDEIEWTRCEGPWEVTDLDLEIGVHFRTEAA